MSCLFDSLAVGLGLSGKGASLRAILCEYLNSNPDMAGLSTEATVRETDDMDLEAYLTRMRLHSTWGGAVELKACADLFEVDVSVRIQSTGRIVDFLPNGEGRYKIQLVWTGGHFEAESRGPPPNVRSRTDIRPNALHRRVGWQSSTFKK